MSEKEKKQFEETVKILMQLDGERLLMTNAASKALLMQQQAEENREKMKAS